MRYGLGPANAVGGKKGPWRRVIAAIVWLNTRGREYWAVPPGDFRPLELSELMDRYPGVPINIEIKGGVAEDDGSYLHVAEVLADFLNRYGRTKGIVVASFNDAALTSFHQLAPDIDLAPATAAVAGYVLGGVPLPPGYEVFQVPPSFQGIPVVTQAFVDRAHGDGYAVHVWTIDDVETMNELGTTASTGSCPPSRCASNTTCASATSPGRRSRRAHRASTAPRTSRSPARSR